NPGATTSPITFTLSDPNGLPVGAPVVISLSARQQMSRFISEIFPADIVGGGFRGSVRLQSSTPFAALGLRFSGQEFSTLPVAATATSAGSSVVILPQFAMSGGWATQIALMNNTAAAMAGRVDVFDPSGNPMAVQLNGVTQSSYTYSIPSGGSFVLAPIDANG